MEEGTILSFLRKRIRRFFNGWASWRAFWRVREFTSVLLGARFHAAVFLDGPLSLSLSLLSPSPFPLISIADQRARRGRLRCSALLCLATGFTAFGYAAALLFLPSLCLPPSVRLAAPSLPPFFPAVGLRIKIRHFIVSKFCEADNIAAPIAAAERRGRARAGTLRCWFCYRINRLSDRFRATNKANEPPPSSTDRERPDDRWRGCCSAGGRFIWATDGWGRRCLSPAAVSVTVRMPIG